MSIERESDKEMGAGEDPLMARLREIEEAYILGGNTSRPWFAAVKHGTIASTVPRHILKAGPWCIDCGRRLQLRSTIMRVAGHTDYLHCLSCAKPATWVKLVPFSGEIKPALPELEWRNAVAPRAPRLKPEHWYCIAFGFIMALGLALGWMLGGL